jgi:hypothetical protein
VLVALGLTGVDAGDVDADLCAAAGRVGEVRTASPSKESKPPRTLVTMAWRATKPMRLWVGSIV